MGFVTVYASDAVLDHSGTITSEMVCCTLNTCPYALGYLPFGMWRFEFHYSIQESVDPGICPYCMC
jgi:hypothetical protein